MFPCASDVAAGTEVMLPVGAANVGPIRISGAINPSCSFALCSRHVRREADEFRELPIRDLVTIDAERRKLHAAWRFIADRVRAGRYADHVTGDSRSRRRTPPANR